MYKNNEIDLYLRTVDECVNDALLLQGKALSLTEEQDLVTFRVQKAKLWLKRQPDYLKFLEHLQNIFHQENIQVFSELLTYFVKDVLNKDKEIIFDLYTYHNLPALKIEAQQNGFREDIYAGNGGSIVNIVSTGLRLIALSRMDNRKFIVLDEPDCWLKPDHVPFFAKIIGEISAQLGIQTIIVSHHSWEYFKDYGRVIELSKQGQYLQADIIHDTPIQFTKEELASADLIERIRLVRFMSHYDTLFELHPHLTCLIGENDLGKSVLPTALRAISYNDSSDSYIRHNESEAQVYIELSQKRSILWQRFAKTTQENPQKVKYSLFLDGITSEPAHHEFNSTNTPDFIQKVLKICTTEDIDVHINNQKQPVFLLSADTKPNQRAKILSLGKESLYIQKIMENIKSKTKLFKQDEKIGEIRFAQITNILSVLDNISLIVDSGKSLKNDFTKVLEDLNNLQNSQEFLEKWFINESIINLGVVTLPDTPELVNTNDHQFIYDNLRLNTSLSEIGNIDLEIESPTIQNTQEMTDLMHNLEFANALSHIGNIDINIPNPDISDTSQWTQNIKDFELSTAISMVGKVDFDIESPQLKDISQYIQGLNTWESMSSLSNLQKIHIDISEPILEDTNLLKENLLQWNNYLEKISTHQKEYELSLIEIQNLQLKIDDFIANTKNICPTCKQPVLNDHLHTA